MSEARDPTDAIAVLDDDTRPPAPRVDGLTAAQQVPGRHLRMIHAHFRDTMVRLSELIEAAAAGRIDPEELAARAGAVPVLDNYRRFGTLCGEHCRVIEIHHAIEDEWIFPELRERSEAMRAVTERLMQEHRVVHALLERLMAALEALTRDPGEDNFAAARDLYQAFEKTLASHFGYEEDAIGDALGVYGVGV
jgi:hypothetical protein